MKYSPLFTFAEWSIWTVGEIQTGRFKKKKTTFKQKYNFFRRILDRAKYFEGKKGQKLYLAKLTLYTVCRLAVLN